MSPLINEAKRFQKLANIIKEAEENQPIDPKVEMEAEKEAFEIAKSSEFNTAMEKEWAKLSDEDRKKLAQSLSSLNEAAGGDFSSFHKMVDKAEEEAEKVISEDASDIKTKIGNIVGTIGKVNTLSFGVPAGIAIHKLGLITGAMSTGPVLLAGIVGGMILWWLGKKIAGEGANKFIDETVNEALKKFRKQK
jgi:hypothetical protein